MKLWAKCSGSTINRGRPNGVELESLLAALGFAMPKKRGRSRANAVGDNSPARKSGRKGGKVKAKYRDPKSNETWSGCGRMASWLKSKQDVGEKIEKYLV